MRRRIALTLLLLIGGVVVNVAVAWGCVLWSTPAFVITNERDPTTGRLVVLTWPYFKENDLSWLANVPADWPTSPTSRSSERTLGLTVRKASAGSAGDPNVQFQAVFEAGLPLRALFAERHARLFMGFGPRKDQIWASTTWRDGFKLPPDPSRLRKVDVLPTLPLWPGFIINTLFYALLLWLLFVAPFTARRNHRCRRGLCEKCAYPIGVSPVCTECGAAVSRRGKT